MTLPLEMVVAFGIAMLLNQRFPGRGIMRTLTILPWMLPGVANGFLWGWLLNGEYGALQWLSVPIRFDQRVSVYWLREPDASNLLGLRRTNLDALCFPDDHSCWLACRASPMTSFDAARVDGANAIHRVRYITLPLLLPSFGIALVVEFIAAFQIFDIVWTLTAGGSAGGAMNPFTKTLMLYNYELVFRDLRVGLGAALSYIILAMSLAVGLIFVWRVYNQGSAGTMSLGLARTGTVCGFRRHLCSLRGCT